MSVMNRIAQIFIILAVTACASKKKKEEAPPPPTRVNMNPTDWDYNKIREVRAAEKAQTPAEHPSDDANCVVMTHTQMVRAKASGCRKMDPREGGGEGSYCCPRE